jgi:hypothetical protein
MLDAEISAREASAARDSATLRDKDVEDQATLAERVALERMSRVENAMTLAS